MVTDSQNTDSIRIFLTAMEELTNFTRPWLDLCFMFCDGAGRNTKQTRMWQFRHRVLLGTHEPWVQLVGGFLTEPNFYLKGKLAVNSLDLGIQQMSFWKCMKQFDHFKNHN